MNSYIVGFFHGVLAMTVAEFIRLWWLGLL